MSRKPHFLDGYLEQAVTAAKDSTKLRVALCKEERITKQLDKDAKDRFLAVRHDRNKLETDMLWQ